MPREPRERLILDVAGGLFAERGYHAVSMEEVAEGADVSKPVVYAYFGSKDSLYRAYIRRSGQELLSRLRQAADPRAAADERLRAGVVEFLLFVEERRDGWSVLYSEATAAGGQLADEIAALRSRIASLVSALLEESVERQGGDCLQAAELEGLAHAFVGAGESLANWWLSHSELPLGEVATWMDTFARGVIGRCDSSHPAKAASRSPTGTSARETC